MGGQGQRGACSEKEGAVPQAESQAGEGPGLFHLKLSPWGRTLDCTGRDEEESKRPRRLSLLLPGAAGTGRRAERAWGARRDLVGDGGGLPAHPGGSGEREAGLEQSSRRAMVEARSREGAKVGEGSRTQGWLVTGAGTLGPGKWGTKNLQVRFQFLGRLAPLSTQRG